MKTLTKTLAAATAIAGTMGFASAALAECSVSCSGKTTSSYCERTFQLSGSVKDTLNTCAKYTRWASKGGKASAKYKYPSKGVSKSISCSNGASCSIR